MDPTPHALLLLGGFLLLGLLADTLARRTRLPRVTLLLLLGMLAGPHAFDVLPPERDVWFAAAAAIALVMVGFILGHEFALDHYRRHARGLFTVTATQAVITALAVGGGLLLFGFPAHLALALAGIATATAPAATQSVVKELDAEGPLTRMLLGVVALDDALALAAFGVLLAVASVLGGYGGGGDALLSALREIGGAIGLGLSIGILAAPLSGRIRPGEPTLLEALSIVLICAGLSMWLDVSYLLAAVVTGSVIANTAKHHTMTFRAIENIEWPFLVVFFLLAGASLELGTLRGIGALGGAYIFLRVAGKMIGAFAGTRLGTATPATRRWLGLTLLPQAGVALGLALLAAERLPDVAGSILSVTVLGTVVFELIGPLMVRVALVRSGEAQSAQPRP